MFMNIMNICEHFMYVNILVVFLDVDMLHEQISFVRLFSFFLYSTHFCKYIYS